MTLREYIREEWELSKQEYGENATSTLSLKRQLDEMERRPRREARESRFLAGSVSKRAEPAKETPAE